MQFFSKYSNQQNSSDFFNSIKQNTIHQIRANILQRQKKNSKIIVKQKPVKDPFLNQKLIENIFTDYLRSKNYNFTYGMFLNQAKLSPQDVLLRSDLLKLIEIQIKQQQCILQGFMKLTQSKKIFSQKGIQTLQVMSNINSESYYDKKLYGLKKELEEIWKKDYEAKLDIFKRQELGKIRQQLKKQLLKDFQRQKNIKLSEIKNYKKVLEKRQEQILKLYKNKSEQLKQQMNKIIQQNTKLKSQIKTMQIQKINHKCADSLKQLRQKLRKQQKSLKQTQKQYKLAISNLNTNVQDIILLKQKIIQKTPNHNIQTSKHLKLNDNISNSLLNAIANLQHRAKILSEQNMSLQKQQNIKNKKINFIENQLVRLQHNLIQQQQTTKQLVGQKDSKQIIHKKNIGVGVNEQLLKQAYLDNKQNEQQAEKERQQDLLEYLENFSRNKVGFIKKVQGISFQMKQIKRKVRNMILEDNL